MASDSRSSPPVPRPSPLAPPPSSSWTTMPPCGRASPGCCARPVWRWPRFLPRASSWTATIRTRPGCLVLDVAMPGLNGLELQQALIAGGHELAIVFLTGHGDIPMSVQAMKRGAVDFLTKPVNDDDLLNAVRVAIEKDRLQRQAARRSCGHSATAGHAHAARARGPATRHHRPAQQANRRRSRHGRENHQGPPGARDGENAGALGGGTRSSGRARGDRRVKSDQ